MKRTDHQIVQQVLDGGVTQDAFDGFQERLREEPELVKLYGDYANLHHNLFEEFEDEEIAERPAPVVRRSVPTAFLWLAAAAALVLMGVLLYPKSRAVSPPAAMMAKAEFSSDAVWQVDGGSRKSGSSLELQKGATLKLDQGQAHVLAGDSVSALIEGPAALTLVSDGALRLSSGRGRFRMEKPDGKLEVTTPSMSAVDLGTEFGIQVQSGLPDELHVFDGKVSMRVNGNSDGEILSQGEAGRIAGADGIERFPSDDSRFFKKLCEFTPVVEGAFVRSAWRFEFGTPVFSEDVIEGENYSAFLRLPRPEPLGGNSVLMATLTVISPATGEFHTAGWAGMSFFSGGKEILFFGDSFGPEPTWSLDVKQRIPVILPENPVVGPHTVTLRYDRRSGEVSLHVGGLPLGASFCRGKLPAGSSFDEIRLGASSSAALAVSGLTIHVGGGE